MFRFLRKMKDESAGVMVENVIVLPLVFVVIIFMIVSAFLAHDKATIEAAARRGATFAAQCIADPKYASLAGTGGALDLDKKSTDIGFSGIGKNVKAYRYLFGNTDYVDDVERRVANIVEETRIPWIPQENFRVECQPRNMIIYHDITVTVTASYRLPKWLDWFGLETLYEVKAEAKMAAVDPDEFIRNADLVVDLITAVDNATGGHVQKAVDKIGSLANKLVDWLEIEKGESGA